MHQHGENCCHDDEPDVLAEFSPEAQAKLTVLRDIQAKHGELEDKLRAEVEALEQKYHALYTPLYEERAQVVKSSVEQIPDFWLVALKNHRTIGDLITETDERALSHLVDVRSHYLTQGKGFKLEFEFTQNDFFTNHVLTKTYIFHTGEEGLGHHGDMQFEKVEGCSIDWKEGKNLCLKTVTKTQRHKTKNVTRTVTNTEPCESFFNYFSPPVVPENLEDLNEDDAYELNEAIQIDFEVSDAIRSNVIPEAVDYFLGLVEDEEDDEEDMDFGEDDDEEDDEDDEEEEDDDEEEQEEQKPRGAQRRRGPAGKAVAGGPAGGAQPQCKQQ